MAGEQDQVVGTAKELQGQVTGDKEREAEGTTQRVAGNVEHAVGNAADKVKGTAEGVKDTAEDR